MLNNILNNNEFSNLFFLLPKISPENIKFCVCGCDTGKHEQTIDNFSNIYRFIFPINDPFYDKFHNLLFGWKTFIFFLNKIMPQKTYDGVKIVVQLECQQWKW